MFRIITPLGATRASSIWIHPSRGGSFASRAESRGVRASAGAFLIYDAS